MVDLLFLDGLIQIAWVLHLIFDRQLLWIVDILVQNLRCLISLLIIAHSQYLLRGCILILLTLIGLLLVSLRSADWWPSWPPRYLGQHWLLLLGKALQLRWRLLINVHQLIMSLLLLMYLIVVLVFVILGLPIVQSRHFGRKIGALGLVGLID